MITIKSAGLWDLMSLELFAENEKNWKKKYGAVHYTPSVYKDLFNLIKRHHCDENIFNVKTVNTHRIHPGQPTQGKDLF